MHPIPAGGLEAPPPDTPDASRIRVLDYLRGIAILGMLIPNIPWHAGDSMSRVLDPDVASVSAWLLQYLVFDQRFMPIFAMLFGAGVALLWDRRGPEGFGAFVSVRYLLLLGIGVGHAYLFWPGDILITYAVCAPFVVLALRLRVRTLLLLALALKSVSVAFAEWPGLYFDTLDRWLFAWWYELGPAPSTIVEAYAGSYADLFRYNAWRNEFLQWTALPYFRIWNALAIMLLGMALYRLRILQGERDPAFYRRMVRTSLLVGGPLVLYGVAARIGINPTVGPWLGFTAELPLRNLTFAIGCLVTSLAVLGGAQLAHRRWSGTLTRAIEATGRMALTNYLLQTVVFFLIFHTFELLPFDQLDHDVFALLALGMVAIHLTLSSWILGRWRQGPVEAAWRRATRRLTPSG